MSNEFPDTGEGYKAAHELSGFIGSSIRFLQGAAKVQERQFQHLLQDHAHSLGQLTSFSPPFMVWLDHLQRRSVHVAEGWQELRELYNDHDHAARANHARLWPESANEQTNADLIERLLIDHERLEKILAAMETLLEAPNPENLDILGSAVDYVAEYPDAYHHPREDQLFTRLLDHDLEAEERRAIERLPDAHEQLAELTRKVAVDFERALESEELDVEALRDSLKEFASAQRDHMHAEERNIFPLAEKYLDRDARVDFEPMPYDPVFDQALSRYENLYACLFGGTA